VYHALNQYKSLSHVLPSDSIYTITLLDIAGAKQSDTYANGWAPLAGTRNGLAWSAWAYTTTTTTKMDVDGG
jgi:hypothetical protein